MSNASQDVPGGEPALELLKEALLVQGDPRLLQHEWHFLALLETRFAHGHQTSISRREREMLEDILEKTSGPDPFDGDC